MCNPNRWCVKACTRCDARMSDRSARILARRAAGTDAGSRDLARTMREAPGYGR